MKRIVMSFMIVSVLGFAGFAQAACTAEEAAEKAQAFATKASTYAQENAEAYAKLFQDNQASLVAIQENPEDFAALCKLYDEMIEKMQ